MEIMAMSAQELVLVKVFSELAEEAFRAEKLIKEHFNSSFGLGKKEIHVYHTESCGEYYGDGYLTIDGVFKYEDNCDAENIYRMLRYCYLRENNLEELETERFDCEIEHIDEEFREFIEKLTNDNN